MLSNSWLYHYYSVQSKIQMGIPFEGSGSSPRIPQINSNYPYTYQPINPQHYQMHQIHQTSPVYDVQGHHLSHHHYEQQNYSPPVSIINHHNDINHNSPTSSSSIKETALVPVDYSQQHSMGKVSPSAVTSVAAHENGNREKIEDYSSEQPSRKKPAADDKSNKLQNHDKKLNKVDYKSVRISNKKYTFKRIESLQISDTVTSATIESDEIQAPPPRAAHIYDNHNNNDNNNDNNHIVMEMEHRDGQMLYLNSSIHSARSRISKSFSSSIPLLPPHVVESTSTTTSVTSVPSAEIIEQWNPSPTWSENNIQKVPDIVHQQLSPYLITTPPTPMSASYIPHTSSFTFDWTPEHYVPVGGMHDDRSIMELAPARCYYNHHTRQQLMSIDDTNHHHHHLHHKDETTVRNS